MFSWRNSLHYFCKPIWCYVMYDKVQMRLFLNANACNVLCCVAIMVEASKGWIGELDARFGGPQLMLNCIIKRGWFLYFFHKLHKGTLIKMATNPRNLWKHLFSLHHMCFLSLSYFAKNTKTHIWKNPKKAKKKEEAG
jgi:hypothetical protein